MDGTMSEMVECPNCGYEWLWSYGDYGGCPKCEAVEIKERVRKKLREWCWGGHYFPGGD